jgi:antirestriction protein
MANREMTKIYLNTWGAYNGGCIGYGWMTPDEARNFIEENPERDGGEWFIADIDNYLGVEFGSLDYANVSEIIDAIEALEELDDCELCQVVALMEYKCTSNAQEAIDDMGSYTFFADIDSYHDCCDLLIDFGGNAMLEQYFDYDAYHRDCDFDIYEARNGVCILA